jgi:NitT/TauT family transport system substrate-binding protein
MSTVRLFLSAVFMAVFAMNGRAIAADPPLAKLRVGVIPIYDTMPLWIGKDAGIFKAEGIDVELVRTTGGATAIPAMAGGSLDIVYSDVGSILKAAQQGLPAKVVAPAGTVTLANGARFMSSANGPVNQLTDMKGKRLAVNQLKNIVNLYAMAALEAAGVVPDSYNVIELPYPQMPDALLNGQVDMIYEVDPFVTILRSSGKARDLGSPTHVIHPQLRIAGYVAVDRWLKANADLARRFQRAYARAAEYTMNNVDKHGEWQVKYFGLKPELKDKVGPGTFLDTDINAPFMESLAKTKGFMLKYKYLDKDMDLNELIFR